MEEFEWIADVNNLENKIEIKKCLPTFNLRRVFERLFLAIL